MSNYLRPIFMVWISTWAAACSPGSFDGEGGNGGGQGDRDIPGAVGMALIVESDQARSCEVV